MMGSYGHEEGMEVVDLGAGWEPGMVGVREEMKYKNQTATMNMRRE